MTVDEFLATLRASLHSLSEPEVNDICADYGAYFREAMADGRSETDVMAALGKPASLAALLASQRGGGAPLGGDDIDTAQIGAFTGNLFLAGGLFLVGLTLVGILLAFAVAAIVFLGTGLALMAVPFPEFGLQGMLTLSIAGHPIDDPTQMAATGFGVFCCALLWLYFEAKFGWRLLCKLAGYFMSTLQAAFDTNEDADSLPEPRQR
jgi:uncharacterized membrane protein